ncbi:MULTISPECIES: family 16 glycosylhydrolase [Catenuloplanes]|uniref:Beta-glucanase (GH16 family) n=1 Tax=Catenuloplanes niger TaxID=587534 RepID=A0AAE4CT24_9ACTN|nr:family 16 glycosylhydrolase [Catenuloplanes niger]MDR7320309.1 beta-glucanase (GH16 family) [Catenuloplanes niger]
MDRIRINGRLGRSLTALVVIGAGLGVGFHLAGGEPGASAASTLVWSDEFDGAAGTGPDAAKWKHDTGGHGWGNDELQNYTDSTRNAALDGDGNLVITARRESSGGREYSSARLLTAGTFSRAYGRFEARIKLPAGQGIWPAFWMLGDGPSGWPDRGEIDIMENVGKDPNRVHGTIHGPGYSGGGASGGSVLHDAPLADAFHTYAIDWSPDLIVWYLDGVEFSRKTPADVGGNRWVFDRPFFMILNVAVGGRWPGSPDGSTRFPQTMVVDYVRVHESGGDDGDAADPPAEESPTASPENPGTSPSPDPSPSPDTSDAPDNPDTPDTPGNPAPPAAQGVALTGMQSGRCVDVPGGQSRDGLPLQIWDCLRTDAQRWTFTADGTVTALGKCLDVAGGNPANGTTIQLAHCNGTGWQQFVLTDAGDLVNRAANRCVDVRDLHTTAGTKLQLWDCAGTPNQKWVVR